MPVIFFEVHFDIFIFWYFLRFLFIITEEYFLHTLDHPVTAPKIYKNSANQHTNRNIVISLGILTLLKRLTISNRHKHNNKIRNRHHDRKQPQYLLQSSSQVEIELMRDNIPSEYKIFILPIVHSQCHQTDNKSKWKDKTYASTE